MPLPGILHRVCIARRCAGVRGFLALQLLGTANTIQGQLDQLLDSVEVDELMVTVDLYDPEKRRHALDILASLPQFRR